MLDEPGSVQLTERVVRELDALLPENTGKFAIAFSGGGDSAALLHLLRNHPKRHCALIVDHGLRAGSEREAAQAADYARSLGFEAHVLRWQHSNPRTGIQEKARHARYGLLGEACRRLGVRALLSAHTQDDQAETLFMRYAHGTGWRGAAGMAPRTYGAIWPELAGIYLIRPLLGIGRQALRDYNRAHDVKWVEDPSNINPKFERIRARQYLADRPAQVKNLLDTAQELRAGIVQERQQLHRQLKDNLTVDPHGIIHLLRLPGAEALSRLIQSASGTGMPVPRDKIKALIMMVSQPAFVSVTLGGAMVSKTSKRFTIFRDPVIAKGRKNSPPIAPVRIPRHDDPSLIWDGRFEIRDRAAVRPADENLAVGVLWGAISAIENGDRDALKAVPPLARASLPAIFKDGNLIGWGSGNFDGIEVKSLIVERISHLF